VPLAAAALAGLLTIDGGFTYDDPSAIEKNVVVNGRRPVTEAFTRDHWGNPVRQGATNYRPLSPIVWRAQWLAGDGSPLPFRIGSLVLHVLAVAALLWLARRLEIDDVPAIVGATLFALHPLRAEAVGAIVGQSDLLASAFGFAALAAALGRSPHKSGVAAAGLLGLACLAKESAFAIGLALIVMLAARRRDALLRAGPSAAVLGVVAIAQALIPRATGFAHPLDNLGYAAEGNDQLLLGFHVLGKSIGMAFVPVGLAPNHGYATVDLSLETLLPTAIVGVILFVIGSVLLALAIARRRGDAALAIGLLVAPAFMQSGLLVDIGTDLTERLLYPSAAAAAMVVAVALQRQVPRDAVRWAALATLGLAAVVGSWSAQRPWHDDAALWAYGVEAEPRSLRARNNAASHAFTAGAVDEGVWHHLVATHLRGRLPARVDPAPLDELSAMEPFERIVIGPRALTDAPCPLVHRFLQTAPAAGRQLALQLWREPYAACFASR